MIFYSMIWHALGLSSNPCELLIIHMNLKHLELGSLWLDQSI